MKQNITTLLFSGVFTFAIVANGDFTGFERIALFLLIAILYTLFDINRNLK